MTPLLSRYATPLITGLFLVSLISGLALFLHVGPRGFHEMHEWLSLALIVPFALHVWKNWRAMVGYLRRAPMALALGLSLLAAVPFLIPSGEAASASGPPPLRLARAVIDHPAAEVAPLLGLAPEALLARLGAAGFAVADPAAPLSRIIRESGRSEFEAMAAMLAPAP